MYNILRRSLLFSRVGISMPYQFVQQYRFCISASTRRGPSAAPTRPDIPGRPWCEITLDTLELGPDRRSIVVVSIYSRSGRKSPPCVVMMRPPLLRRLRTSACVGDRRKWCVWPGQRNRIFQCNRRVSFSSVWHYRSYWCSPASAVTRRCLANVNSADWKQDLKLLLFYYNTRPHGSTHLPPMEAMFGWQPRSFIVDSPDTDLLLSEWVIRLSKRSAAICDYIEEELSRRDFVSDLRENP